MKTQMKNGIQKGVRVKDRTWPIFHDDDTHTSEDKTSPYICVGTGVWGVGFPPREAISHAVSKGLSRQKDHWAIWENLVPHGRLRLVDGSGLTVVLPSDISDEDKNIWHNPLRAQRLRMIACSLKFSSRIIRTRSDRLEEKRRRIMHEQTVNTEAAIDAVEELLKGDAYGD